MTKFIKLGLLHLGMALLLSWQAMAQLSPGDLSRAHAELEGISNCTQCHTLGEKVSNDKCLACHTEIRSRLDARAGYHYSREVRGKDCSTCHSEHHGRGFDMVRFDEDAFDHRLTGYALEGAHARVDCRQCHMPDNIDNPELRRRQTTFLGLGTDCLDCHDDYHQKTLGTDCAQCHGMEAFVPATRFDHHEADFALKGAHIEVECLECHQVEIRSGREFQVFTGLDFANCNACHQDAHRSQLGTDCRSCHVEESFNSRTGLAGFNHNTTGFPLKGRHSRVDCAGCHQMEAGPTRIFQDRLGIATNACATCHEDVHEGKFGTNCAECHTETGFRFVADIGMFNHDLTDFALEGKHQMVDCRACHVSESLTDPLPFNTCTDCHDDYHEGDFTQLGNPAIPEMPDCAACHVVEGFSPSLFTLEMHAASDFPLDGAHLATPCFACHLEDKRWEFREIGRQCVDCHEDVHAGEIAEVYYPGQDCRQCHFTSSWTDAHVFEHAQTDFVLEGAHLETDCAACHTRDEFFPYGKFGGLSHTCTACHENIHGSQFALEGVTDCRQCHGFADWKPVDFDHDQTAFPLEGRHAEIACAECHREVLLEGEMRVQYRIGSFECIDCHN